MHEARSTVRLAEGVPFDVSTRGVTATLRRSEIEQAARSEDESIELLLDVRRGQGADVEAHSLAVEWSRPDLDRLLREAGNAEEVTIAFDRDEMGAAVDAETDVEAHGVREKALVLTVVAVSALSTAGAAQAMPGTAGSGDAAPVVSAAAPTPVQSPATTIGGAAGASTVASDVSPATTIGGAGPAPTAAPATGTGATASSDAPPQVEVRGEAAARTLPSAVGDSSVPLGEGAAVVGGIGLAIAAAGFAAAGTRRKSIRPA
jgi:hypothetical protein